MCDCGFFLTHFAFLSLLLNLEKVRCIWKSFFFNHPFHLAWEYGFCQCECMLNFTFCLYVLFGILHHKFMCERLVDGDNFRTYKLISEIEHWEYYNSIYAVCCMHLLNPNFIPFHFFQPMSEYVVCLQCALLGTLLYQANMAPSSATVWKGSVINNIVAIRNNQTQIIRQSFPYQCWGERYIENSKTCSFFTFIHCFQHHSARIYIGLLTPDLLQPKHNYI